MASSALPLRLPPPVPCGLHRPPLKSGFLSPLHVRITIPVFASASGSSSGGAWEREEARWQREEERWLREERRWLREEARWAAERAALLSELAALRARVRALEEATAAVRAIEEVTVAPRAALVEEAEVKEIVLEGFIAPEAPTEEVKEMVLEGFKASKEEKESERRVLRRGAEGKDVRAMQEALLKLGFYSGEEDMEYSSFSSGTERAVKTWQSALGLSEDGIMTIELLERLLMERGIRDTSSKVTAEKDGPNGALASSVTEIAEIQQTVIKESGGSEVEVSQHRVFLLGENRWEEPSRLAGRDKLINRDKPVSTTKCLSCRGEGRLMCTECDGTGEPNIEPQFLEWVNEGMKCPYCEGLGYTICDDCDGKKVVQT